MFLCIPFLAIGAIGIFKTVSDDMTAATGTDWGSLLRAQLAILRGGPALPRRRGPQNASNSAGRKVRRIVPIIKSTASAGSGRALWIRLIVRIALVCAMSYWCKVQAGDFSLTNDLANASVAETRGDVQAALEIYAAAESQASTNAADWCALSRGYCDLMCLTNSAPAKTELLKRALRCASQAVKVGPANATAHACLAVCYAQRCAFADIKGQLADARRFKQEAEKTLALDPKQDIAYYLLGRWNYAIANVGLLSRAYVKIVYGGLPPASDEAAIEDFQKAIALAPGRIIHHAGLALAYEATGDKKREIAELEKCRALKPTDCEDAAAQRAAEQKLAALGR